jgi:ribosomal protein L16 Arg81 hydroxylase
MKKIGEVEKVKQMTRDGFFSHFYRQQPVILCGAIDHWRAVREWSPELLKQRYGDTPVRVDHYDPNLNSTFLDQHIDYVHKHIPLREYLDSLDLGQRYAMRENEDLLAKHPELVEEMDQFRPFGRGEHGEEPYIALWFGPAGDFTGLHIDIGESQLFQLYGRKRFIIFAPDQTPFLYEEGNEKLQQLEASSRIDPEDLDVFQNYIRWSAVNPLRPDYERYPLSAQAGYLDGWVEPGEVVYVPSGWWHAVQYLTVSISVTKSLDEEGFLRQAA